MRGIIFSVKHTGRLPLSLIGRAVEGHMPCRRLTLLWAVPFSVGEAQLLQKMVVLPTVTCLLFQVACADGNLYTLTVPQLQVLSKVVTFPYTSMTLTCSPDQQWVFVLAKGSDVGPKVSAW